LPSTARKSEASRVAERDPAENSTPPLPPLLP
jgi:hypothetical protein